MALSQQLQTVLTSNQVPAPFSAWLLNSGVLTVAQIVMAARGELQHVEQELIIGCSLQLNLAEKVAICVAACSLYRSKWPAVCFMR